MNIEECDGCGAEVDERELVEDAHGWLVCPVCDEDAWDRLAASQPIPAESPYDFGWAA